MDRKIIEKYINSQKQKVVTRLELEQNKITYSGIVQNNVIDDCSDDEEITRAFILTRLVNELGYAAEDIEIERKYTAGRPYTNKSRSDLVVRDSRGNAFLFFEIKKPDVYRTIDKDEIIKEQLYKVSFMEQAEGHKVKYLVLYTISENEDRISDECMIIDAEKYPTFADWENARDYTNILPSKYGKTYHKPYVKGSDKDLESHFTSGMLNRIQLDLHNVLWGGGGTDDNEVFASLTNLILAKVQDENTVGEGREYKFQVLVSEQEEEQKFESNEQLFERINELYREALKEKLYISDKKELEKSYVIDVKKFSLSKLRYAVQKLEGLSLIDGKNSLDGKDILGEFFEGIIRGGFKQSKGQFFTHVNIVRFMLWGVQADKLAIQRINKYKELPYMIDPSAGSGTFLVEYMKFITENIKYRFREKLGTSRDIKEKVESDWFYPDFRENKWAQTYIYGIEFNFNLGTAAKVNMILHGDGATNIFVKDGLLPFYKYMKENEPNILHNSKKDPKYYDKNINGKFDLILTNPPFSVNLDNDTKKMVKENFLFGDKKNSENLFIERWYQLLRENGRVAAVLPESVFDTTENKYIRLFLYKYFKIKAVVSLPQLAFEPYTSTKTSILFAQKKTSGEISEWNSLWGQASKEYEKLKTRVENLLAVYDGLKEKNELPSIKNMTPEEEKSILIRMLKSYATDTDRMLTAEELIKKYRMELESLCTVDKDTREYFGYVNTWWVFGEVAPRLSCKIFMAEADDIGYKRSKRGEKEQNNELYKLEYAPTQLDTDEIAERYRESIERISELISNETEKKEAEKKADKLEQIENKIKLLKADKQKLERDYEEIKRFIGKYYSAGILKEDYKERTDNELIEEFKNGRLQNYRSNYVALHESTYVTVLDYMRNIKWE